MKIESMPFCCTSAILGSFGEHGEESIVTVDEIQRLIAERAQPRRNKWNELLENGKRCVFAISVDPRNVRMLKEAGFKEVDSYPGVQGTVHILTFHVGNDVE